MLNFYNIPIFSEFSNRLEQLRRQTCRRYSWIRRLFCPAVPLVYADEVTGSIGSDTVLILSPSDYWALRVELNVKSETDAVKYAPALFDVGEGYGFQAQKIAEGTYVLIAYERAHLTQMLRDKPALAAVKKLTFSQWIFAGEQHPIRLNSGRYLTVVDGIVIEMDAAYIDSHDSVRMDDALAHYPPLYKTISTDDLLSALTTPKTMKMTLAILVILLANLVAQIVLDRKSADEINEKIQEVLDASHLPGTSIEREAVFDSLKRKEEKQLKLREQFYTLSTVPLKVTIPEPVTVPSTSSSASASPDGVVLIPGSKPGEPNRLLIGGAAVAAASGAGMAGIREIQYDGNSIKIRIDTTDAENAEYTKNEILKRFKKARVDVHENQVEVRLK